MYIRKMNFRVQLLLWGVFLCGHLFALGQVPIEYVEMQQLVCLLEELRATNQLTLLKSQDAVEEVTFYPASPDIIEAVSLPSSIKSELRRIPRAYIGEVSSQHNQYIFIFQLTNTNAVLRSEYYFLNGEWQKVSHGQQGTSSNAEQRGTDPNAGHQGTGH